MACWPSGERCPWATPSRTPEGSASWASRRRAPREDRTCIPASSSGFMQWIPRLRRSTKASPHSCTGRSDTSGSARRGRVTEVLLTLIHTRVCDVLLDTGRGGIAPDVRVGAVQGWTYPSQIPIPENPVQFGPRLHENARTDLGRAPAADRQGAQVGEAPPEPFGGAVAEGAQPQRT